MADRLSAPPSANASIWLAPALVVAALTAFLAPSVAWFDAGELGASAAVLGVPHPTGFSFFVLQGHVWSLIPLANLALRVHLMGAVAAVAAIALWLRADWLPGPGFRWHIAPLILLPLLQGALLMHVRATEVYPQVWLVVAASLAVWHGLPRPQALLALPVLAAIGTAVHAEAGLIAGLFWIQLAKPLLLRRRPDVVLPLASALLGIVTLAMLISYLPLSAHRIPGLSWGDVRSAFALWRHVSAASIRAAFADRMGAGSGPLALWHFLAASKNHLIFLAIPALFGAWHGLGNRRRWTVATLGIIGCDAAYSAWVNPMGLRDDQAGLLVLIGIGILAAQGLEGCVQGLYARRKVLGHVGVLAIFTGTCLLGLLTLKQAPMADVRAAGQGADDLWHDVEPGSLLLASADHTASACLWSQVAEGVRPDSLCLPIVFTRDFFTLGWLSARTNNPAWQATQAAVRSGARPAERLKTWLRPALDQGPVLWQPGQPEEDSQIAGHLQWGLPWSQLLQASQSPQSVEQRVQALSLAAEASCTRFDCEQSPVFASHLSAQLGVIAALITPRQPGLGVQLLRQAHRYSPASAPILGNLAVAELQAGHAAQALELCRQALAAQPDYDRAHRTAVRAALRLRRLDLAKEEISLYLKGKHAAPELLAWLQSLEADVDNADKGAWHVAVKALAP